MTSLRRLGIAAIVAGAAAWAFFQAGAAKPAPLSSVVPSGALLYVETRDLAAVLKDWNTSPEKAAWVKSDNYQVFSRSKLAQRLAQARDEFAAVAGFPPGMATLENVAGQESALAIYDIGQLHFVFVTRLGAGRALPAALTKARPAYQARKAAGFDYYVATAKDTGRVAAYALANNLLVLATREDLVAATLRIVGGGAGTPTPVAKDAWYERASQAAATSSPGEIRIAGDMTALARSPHFRSYWVQQNITELKQFAAFVSDIQRSAGEIREERVLVRAQAAEPNPSAAPAVAQLLPLVPNDAGFYRAWAGVSPAEAAALLAEKVLAPRSELKPRIEPAPAAEGPPAAPPTAEGDEQGEESGQPRANTAAEPMPDLERRIDEAPITAVSAKIEFAGLERALAGNAPEAALQIEGTRLLPDGVFVGVRSAVVLLGKGNWDEAAMRRQIAATLAPLFPATGGATLHPVEIAVRGRLLIVTNDAGLLPSLAAPASPPAANGIVYAAGYRHSRELPLFARMTRMIDAPQRQGRAPNEERQPLFFSENLASLGGAMRRLESATITVRDTGTTLPQTVVYRLAPAPAAATR